MFYKMVHPLFEYILRNLPRRICCICIFQWCSTNHIVLENVFWKYQLSWNFCISVMDGHLSTVFYQKSSDPLAFDHKWQTNLYCVNNWLIEAHCPSQRSCFQDCDNSRFLFIKSVNGLGRALGVKLQCTLAKVLNKRSQIFL